MLADLSEDAEQDEDGEDSLARIDLAFVEQPLRVVSLSERTAQSHVALFGRPCSERGPPLI